MDKPKTKPKESKSESKEQRFNRIASSRASKVLKYLRLLGNCSNKSNYTFTQEQVDKLFDTIYDYTERMQSKFIATTENQDTFEF